MSIPVKHEVSSDHATEEFDFVGNKWNTDEKAKKYSQKNIGSRKDAREKACITRTLKSIPAGSRILDLPCGTGRMVLFLSGLGYQVTGADYSTHMIEQAQKAVSIAQENNPSASLQINFEQQDISKLTYGADAFDGIVCNRLFHHYNNPVLRQKALSELGRVSRGPIIVSFFSNMNLSTLRLRIKNSIRGIQTIQRNPIPLSEFQSDVEAVGLKIDQIDYVNKYISSQTYLKLSRR